VNPFTTIVRFFEKRRSGPSEVDKQWREGYKAFEKGKQHYLARGENQDAARRIQDALDCFDKAIAFGFREGGIYGSRGSCLQILHFDLDAIDDFNRAIPLEPEDSNLHYMRSVAKGATGDLDGCIVDLTEAIRLSEIDNKLNNEYNLWAKEHGYESIRAMYVIDLLKANLDLEAQAFEERVRRECELRGLDLPVDLVSRRPAQSRRRAQDEFSPHTKRKTQ
jgi:tetratricopeptide (TPR) repeat protein